MSDITDFDFDGWLAGAVRPSRQISVTRNRRLADEVNALLERLEAARALEASLTADDAGAESQGRRLVGGSPVADAQEAQAEIKAELQRLRESTAGDWLDIVISGFDPQVHTEVRSAKDGFGATLKALVGGAQVRPHGASDDALRSLTEEQWAALGRAVGVAQWAQIDNALVETTFTGAVSPDFWAPSSPSDQTS